MNYNIVDYVTCSICKSIENELLSQKVQFNMPYSIVICKKCGFVYMNPVPKKEELNNFYKYEYSKYYGKPVSHNDENYKKRGHEIYEFTKDIIRDLDSCLEIGAGGGGNLIGLIESYNMNIKEVGAIEPGADSNESIKQFGIPILGGFYDENNYNLKMYDLVILSHVLEHFYSPGDILRKLHKETNEKVSLYIAIPCLKSLLKNTNKNKFSPLEEKWYRIVHLSYFHEKNIEDLLLNCGWNVIKKEHNSNGELKLLVNKLNENEVQLEMNNIRNAYDEHRNDIDEYNKRIDFNNIIIFGGSKFGQIASMVLETKYNILYFCDNDKDKWGKKINGKTIISPNELIEIYHSIECQIVIASSYSKEIKEQLSKLGLENNSSFDFHYNLLYEVK